MMTIDQLRYMIEQAIPGSRVEVTDLTGTSDHFGVHVVSPAFEGKTLLEQHKMIHAACGDHLTTTIHALQIKTETP